MKLIAALMMAAAPGSASTPDVELLDFTASYCSPCQQMVPVLQRMENDGYPIRKIDTTKNPEVTRQYRVDVIPTLILMVEGREVERFVGLQSEEKLRQLMQDAARKLDMARRPDDADRPEQKSAAARERAPEPAADEKPGNSGLAAIVGGIKDRLNGAKPNEERFEFPTFRGQSPDAVTDASTGAAASDRAMQATVRITVTDGRVQDFGTGTIVHSEPGTSTILTCAHLYQGVARDAITNVELFRDGKSLRYPAKVIGGDRDSDLAFLQIATTSALPSAPILSADRKAFEGDSAFSIGCSNGKPPTQMSMKIVSLNRYNGPANIVCTGIPQKGRSGGGLFNAAGELIGVCSCADKKQNEGLYMSYPAIRKLIAERDLQQLFDDQPHSPARSVIVQDRSEPDPALDDEAIFNELVATQDATPFEEKTQPQASAAEPAIPMDDAAPFGQPTAPQPGAAHRQPAAAVAFVPGASESTSPTEITVTFNSRQGKQVIVIPKPSPWLLQILSGQAPNTGRGVATAQNVSLRPVSSRAVTGSAMRRGTPLPPAQW